jgi:flagellar brake protein
VEAVTEAAVRSRSILCTTQLDQVKMQFRMGPCQRGIHDGTDSIRSPLPDALLRLQRRENFRLATTIGPALTCKFLFEGKKPIEARVLDLSTGGLSLAIPTKTVSLHPGMELEECRILLTGIGAVEVDLRVRSVFLISAQAGDVQRVGCQFISLSPEIRNSIQLYIMDVERKRRASRDD